MITQGTWTAKNGCVLTNIPPDRPGYIWEDKESEYSFYGGYIVCESAMKDDARLIAAAPEMIELLTAMVDTMEDVPSLPFWLYWESKRLIDKSLGGDFAGEFKNPYAMIKGVHDKPQLCLPAAPINPHHSYFSVENRKPWIATIK